jgi:hypothetical protein
LKRGRRRPAEARSAVPIIRCEMSSYQPCTGVNRVPVLPSVEGRRTRRSASAFISRKGFPGDDPLVRDDHG